MYSFRTIHNVRATATLTELGFHLLRGTESVSRQLTTLGTLASAVNPCCLINGRGIVSA
jgi:hypothetical protein